MINGFNNVPNNPGAFGQGHLEPEHAAALAALAPRLGQQQQRSASGGSMLATTSQVASPLQQRMAQLPTAAPPMPAQAAANDQVSGRPLV